VAGGSWLEQLPTVRGGPPAVGNLSRGSALLGRVVGCPRAARGRLTLLLGGGCV
jgi:hypothetical protein